MTIDVREEADRVVGVRDEQPEHDRVAASGHRLLTHTADVRIEAWGRSREECLIEAVSALVESFADVGGVRPSGEVRVFLAARPGATDEDLLVDLLNEVIARLDIDGQVPVAAEAEIEDDRGIGVRLAMADLADVRIVAAAPKAISLHQLRFGPDRRGWLCHVIVDV